MQRCGLQRHSVRALGIISVRRSIPSGVPQVSHLGPLLFDVYINDIHRQFAHSKFLIYADDIKIYNRITCPRDASLL